MSTSPQKNGIAHLRGSPVPIHEIWLSRSDDLVKTWKKIWMTGWNSFNIILLFTFLIKNKKMFSYLDVYSLLEDQWYHCLTLQKLYRSNLIRKFSTRTSDDVSKDAIFAALHMEVFVYLIDWVSLRPEVSAQRFCK